MKLSNLEIDIINISITKIKSICDTTSDCTNCEFGYINSKGIPQCMFNNLPSEWKKLKDNKVIVDDVII